ncbi:MAG: LacI family DNA-binding transcriptional regulator [Caldilineaceae bacterium]|nr:LacI family DNA-binding transcriptional regulator [Caldilineaceae bacterium]
MDSDKVVTEVSMQDLADIVGVSLSTVSRALADSPRVKLATRQQIQQLAKEMGYLPNAIARGLATRRTYTLGVVVRDIADPFIAELVRTIDKIVLTMGFTLLLVNCDADSQQELAAITELRHKRVDGIIVPDMVVDDDALPMLEKMGVPVVLVNRKQYPFTVGTDNIAAARLGMNYLLALGHTRIAYIGSHKAREDDTERRTGYEQALAEHKLTLDPVLVIRPTTSSPDSGVAGFEQLFTLDHPPTAIFCFDDITALGVIHRASAARVQIPEKLSVLGFDNIALASYFAPALTTIAQQTDQIAQQAVAMMLCLLAGEKPPARPLLAGKLVIRNSTAAPRSA